MTGIKLGYDRGRRASGRILRPRPVVLSAIIALIASHQRYLTQKAIRRWVAFLHQRSGRLLRGLLYRGLPAVRHSQFILHHK
jgi:hypothetical protein